DIGAYEHAPPSVATDAPNPVAADSATLRGHVNPNAQATTYHFEYGPTTAYGSSTAGQNLAAGVDAAQVSAAVAGLTQGTTFHVRLVATNADGTATSADRAFTTADTQ